MKLYNNYKKTFFEEIGRELNRLRVEKGLELSEMKEIVGHSAKKMADIEAGEDSRLLMMPLGQLMRIFEYFEKKFRLEIEDLTVEDRIGTMLNGISSEELIKFVAMRNEKLTESQEKPVDQPENV